MHAKLIVLALISGGLAGSASPTGEWKIAQGGSCTEICRAQYNQCRIATKGSPSCDAQFAACMQRCIASRR